MESGEKSVSENTLPFPVSHAKLTSGTRVAMKSKGVAKNEPSGREPSEFERFTGALQKILSVRKSDLDLHKPIRPRKNAKRKKSTS
jgi:hypothetical protein